MPWKLHCALYGLRTSPKMWREHQHATLQGMHLHQLKSDLCLWVKKNSIVLAYVDDLLIAGASRDATSFLERLRQSFSLKHSTVLTSQQLFASWESASVDIPMVTSRSVLNDHTTTACSRAWTSMTTTILHLRLPGGDLQYNKTDIWIQIDITSTAKRLACSSG